MTFILQRIYKVIRLQTRYCAAKRYAFKYKTATATCILLFFAQHIYPHLLPHHSLYEPPRPLRSGNHNLLALLLSLVDMPSAIRHP